MEPQEDPLKDATTLYVGNLSFYTTEEQVYELFSKCGEIKRLVMGLDRFNKTFIMSQAWETLQLPGAHILKSALVIGGLWSRVLIWELRGNEGQRNRA